VTVADDLLRNMIPQTPTGSKGMSFIPHVVQQLEVYALHCSMTYRTILCVLHVSMYHSFTLASIDLRKSPKHMKLAIVEAQRMVSKIVYHIHKYTAW
jgi:hypothetical protein